MERVTLHCKLIEQVEDINGYIIYVFELCNYTNLFDRYIMCTRFPNWEHKQLTINEEGYLEIIYLFAGVDKWYDGEELIPYNYNITQFNKFIPKTEDYTEIIID